ncbi:MAG: hypothetical protein CO030_02315 [Candidatus Magasanikbacteria bacterium CG_4_9_14_0_2_um_filter_42_11]|uniref:Uncharacterized protein n=1 Tax=Candidatus Magasanikbacteria bacterium CG_4_9_14_0_2_um_filter_42_11 TaxID=1974643 RepID=A0A2M8F9Z8_9BACT|nr:MAG: hypothetical protein COY70_00985 [Candidatus Magasanikbacteria bacterium CG_4_10_14_0_8_um_filter_42_12]PJC52536.1 MAG: hypothetical protein CO030_02315 [Candidatus Magasanikbacteria bacterium CG_4_9_14_0_2_um_filter_42_11]
MAGGYQLHYSLFIAEESISKSKENTSFAKKTKPDRSRVCVFMTLVLGSAIIIPMYQVDNRRTMSLNGSADTTDIGNPREMYRMR